MDVRKIVNCVRQCQGVLSPHPFRVLGSSTLSNLIRLSSSPKQLTSLNQFFIATSQSYQCETFKCLDSSAKKFSTCRIELVFFFVFSSCDQCCSAVVRLLRLILHWEEQCTLAGYHIMLLRLAGKNFDQESLLAFKRPGRSFLTTDPDW